MKRFQMNVPDELHKKMKLYCVEHNTQMTEIILRLVEEFLAKKDKRQKK